MPANDSTQLLNNLRPTKTSNLDRCKLNNSINSYNSDNESNASGSTRAGTYSVNYSSDMSQKNFNADRTNPNLYNIIDENKEEHVYDEIKQKEGYKDPGNLFEHFIIFFLI